MFLGHSSQFLVGFYLFLLALKFTGSFVSRQSLSSSLSFSQCTALQIKSFLPLRFPNWLLFGLIETTDFCIFLLQLATLLNCSYCFSFFFFFSPAVSHKYSGLESWYLQMMTIFPLFNKFRTSSFSFSLQWLIRWRKAFRASPVVDLLSVTAVCLLGAPQH